MYEYAARVVKVVDGDTVDLTVDLGLRTYQQARVRLYGINAPEHNTPEGVTSKAWLEQQLPVGLAVVVQTHKDKTEKYGRWLADIFVSHEDLVAGHSVNAVSVEAGMAKDWDGKGARPV
jgi:micrococcal nuclease